MSLLGFVRDVVAVGEWRVVLRARTRAGGGVVAGATFLLSAEVFGRRGLDKRTVRRRWWRRKRMNSVELLSIGCYIT